MAVSALGRPTARKRALPRSGDHRGVLKLPDDLGTCTVQSVGNCIRTTGADVFIHRAGEEESAPGCLRFRVLIDPTWGVLWRPTSNGLPRGWCGDFSDEERLAAAVIVEGMRVWNPSCYMFHVLGAAETAYNFHRDRLMEAQRSIANYTELLASYAPNGRKWMTGMGGPYSPAQMFEHRLGWMERRARAEEAIVDQLVVYGDTLHMLRRVLRTIHYACTTSCGPFGRAIRTNLAAEIDEAIHPTRPEEHRGLTTRWRGLAGWNPAEWPWAEPGPAWD